MKDMKLLEQNGSQNHFMNRLSSFWVALTSVYLIVLYLFKIKSIAAFIGFFVPLGISNVIYSFSNSYKWLIVFPLVFVTVFGGEKLLRKKNVLGWKKVFFILMVLFFLTIVVDFIIWGEWQSFKYFLKGGTLEML